jgi:NADPH:quinone reductase-like Zn-dependent oxidoreductase
MKAIRIHDYGDASALKYEDAPVPEPTPDWVLIKVHAAGVNPVDWKIRKGLMRAARPLQFPRFSAATSPARSSARVRS